MARTIRVGVKSGVLPQPRQVVPRMKTSYEIAQEAKARTGFADPAMAPRGSAANPPPRAAKTAAEKIRDSAKPPRTEAKEHASEQRAWRKHLADVRRAYLTNSLQAYEEQEKRHKEMREKRQAPSDTQPLDVQDSAATQLTMPTIESSLLQGKMVEPRTPEEQEELRLKREYNRKRVEHDLLTKQSEQLLSLYQQASQFIVTSDQLESAVTRAFRPDESVPSLGQNQNQTPAWFKYLRAYQLENELSQATQRSREALLAEAVKGTVSVREATRTGKNERELPGLKEVRAALEQYNDR